MGVIACFDSKDEAELFVETNTDKSYEIEEHEFKDICLRSETVRIEFSLDWAEVRIGNAEITVMHDTILQPGLNDDNLDCVLLGLLDFAKAIAEDRGEKLEWFDPRSDDGVMWMGKDVRDHG